MLTTVESLSRVVVHLTVLEGDGALALMALLVPGSVSCVLWGVFMRMRAPALIQNALLLVPVGYYFALLVLPIQLGVRWFDSLAVIGCAAWIALLTHHCRTASR